MKKAVFVPIAAIVLGAALLLNHGEVSAKTMINPSQSLVQTISQKFGLNQADVQAVFDEHRSQLREQAESRFEERLTQDVTDGKLTEAQKQAILAKRAQLAANRPDASEFDDQTREERQATREQHRQELVRWAQENGIDLRYLMGGMGRYGGGHGPMMEE